MYMPIWSEEEVKSVIGPNLIYNELPIEQYLKRYEYFGGIARTIFWTNVAAASDIKSQESLLIKEMELIIKKVCSLCCD
jgi:hypothetical protein